MSFFRTPNYHERSDKRALHKKIDHLFRRKNTGATSHALADIRQRDAPTHWQIQFWMRMLECHSNKNNENFLPFYDWWTDSRARSFSHIFCLSTLPEGSKRASKNEQDMNWHVMRRHFSFGVISFGAHPNAHVHLTSDKRRPAKWDENVKEKKKESNRWCVGVCESVSDILCYN